MHIGVARAAHIHGLFPLCVRDTNLFWGAVFHISVSYIPCVFALSASFYVKLRQLSR
jgi:hypothetical protein